MYCGITNVPETFAVGNGDMMTFSDNAAFWVFNQVTNFAYTRTRLLIGDLQKKQSELEDGLSKGNSKVLIKLLKLFIKRVLQKLSNI